MNYFCEGHFSLQCLYLWSFICLPERYVIFPLPVQVASKKIPNSGEFVKCIDKICTRPVFYRKKPLSGVMVVKEISKSSLYTINTRQGAAWAPLSLSGFSGETAPGLYKNACRHYVALIYGT